MTFPFEENDGQWVLRGWCWCLWTHHIISVARIRSRPHQYPSFNSRPLEYWTVAVTTSSAPFNTLKEPLTPVAEKRQIRQAQYYENRSITLFFYWIDMKPGHMWWIPKSFFNFIKNNGTWNLPRASKWVPSWYMIYKNLLFDWLKSVI